MAIWNTGDWPCDATTTTGTDLADRLSRLVDALDTQHANPTRPGYIKAGGVWTQTVPAGGYKLYFYDGTKDHEIGSVSASGTASFGGGVALAPNFSATTAYAAGDIIYDPATKTYLQAKNAVAAGAYNPGDWQTVTDVLGSTTGSAVKKSGDTMTGPLAVPAGATGTHVPQVQEVVKKSGDTMTGPLGLSALNGLTVGGVPVLAGPAFMAIPVVDQTVTSGVTTKVTLGNEIFDTNANFVNSTFTPTVAGYYQVNGIVRGTSASSNVTSVVANIHKNGAVYSQAFGVSAGIANIQVSISSLVYMNGLTDKIELYGSVTGTNPFFDHVSDGSCCQFSACLVRALV